jgi:aconitate hydratase
MEVQQAIRENINPEMFTEGYATLFSMSTEWAAIHSNGGNLYEWEDSSTYIQAPPFFEGLDQKIESIPDIHGARVLVLLGDSITTDHISPAGSIAVNSPAGEYLMSQGVNPSEFNSYGSRRGNDRVMTRGTFGNIRLKNLLVPGVDGGSTHFFPTNETTTIFNASQRYRVSGTPLVVIAGKEYGTGSSRDWAAKGVLLLGVKVVIAESYERIHRSNLAGMGVLPLQFLPGQSATSLGITGEEVFDFYAIEENLKPGSQIHVHATKADGSVIHFETNLRLDTALDATYYRNGGIMPALVKKLLAA